MNKLTLLTLLLNLCVSCSERAQEENASSMVIVLVVVAVVIGVVIFFLKGKGQKK